MFDIKNTSQTPQLISARALILMVGIIGFMLPIVLILAAVALEGCEVVQNTISAYYHTISRNLFVGIICAIALCLFAYRGYSKVDNVAGNLAAIFALGVAFFPTSVSAPFTKCLPEAINTGILGKIHLISAGLVFLIFAFFCLYLFTQTSGIITPAKRTRNKIYKICGYGILLFIFLIALYFLYLKNQFPGLAAYSPVFWLETLCLWAFSISWLTKSEIFLKD